MERGRERETDGKKEKEKVRIISLPNIGGYNMLPTFLPSIVMGFPSILMERGRERETEGKKEREAERGLTHCLVYYEIPLYLDGERERKRDRGKERESKIMRVTQRLAKMNKLLTLLLSIVIRFPSILMSAFVFALSCNRNTMIKTTFHQNELYLHL